MIIYMEMDSGLRCYGEPAADNEAARPVESRERSRYEVAVGLQEVAATPQPLRYRPELAAACLKALG